MKRQRWTSGAILQIVLPNGQHSYAQMLPHEQCEIAVFDRLTDEDIPEIQVSNLPVLFRVAVHKSAYNAGRWVKKGKAPIQESLRAVQETYIQDTISGEFSIYRLGEIRKATRDECVGLEACAVWDPHHVEDRIIAHYAGKNCKWLDDFWRK